MPSSDSNYAFVIPAFNPTDNLLLVVKNIRQKIDNIIFVIDDGSKNRNIFKKLQKYQNVVHLTHAINLGKGAALKTVFNHILTQCPNIKGVVTLDSDGQHSIKDCIRVLGVLKKEANAFVLV